MTLFKPPKYQLCIKYQRSQARQPVSVVLAILKAEMTVSLEPSSSKASLDKTVRICLQFQIDTHVCAWIHMYRAWMLSRFEYELLSVGSSVKPLVPNQWCYFGKCCKLRGLDLSGGTTTVEVYQFPTPSGYKEQIIKAGASQSLAWRSQVSKQQTEFSTSGLRHGKSGIFKSPDRPVARWT